MIEFFFMPESESRYKKIMILTVDTDVVVIALYAYWELNVTEMWIEFSKGKDL